MLLGTGSTMLNLAMSGDPAGGFRTGHYYLFCGDSNSGKTWLAMTCFAEASIDPRFDEYRLIYDGPEGGALMDRERYFGRRAVERMEPPRRWDDGSPRPSETVQEFYFAADDALKKCIPFIYVLDSQDALSSDEEKGKFEELKKANRKGKETTGSYGDSKAKCHSANLRKLLGPLARSGSILLVLNQTRDSFDPFQPSTYSGGRALLFYATAQLWSSKAGDLSRMVRGKKRQLGITAKVRVRKNRTTGRDRTVLVPIYHSSGIDDVGGMADYLVSEGAWEEEAGLLTIRGLGPEKRVRREGWIRELDEDGVEEVRGLAASVWSEVEAACQVERRNRYAV